jgi:hypothetical protein
MATSTRKWLVLNPNNAALPEDQQAFLAMFGPARLVIDCPRGEDHAFLNDKVVQCALALNAEAQRQAEQARDAGRALPPGFPETDIWRRSSDANGGIPLIFRHRAQVTRQDLAIIQRFFPQAAIADVPNADVRHPLYSRRARLRDLMKRSILVGVNRFGQEVYETEATTPAARRNGVTRERFILAEQTLYWETAPETTPEMVLRAGSQADLVHVADGLVAEMLGADGKGGRIIHRDDIERMVRTAFDVDATIAVDEEQWTAGRRAIELAIAHRIARMSGAATRDAYKLALRMADNSPEMIGEGRSPLPLVVLAQNILGGEGDFRDQRVVYAVETHDAMVRVPSGVSVSVVGGEGFDPDRFVDMNRSRASIEMADDVPAHDLLLAEYHPDRDEAGLEIHDETFHRIDYTRVLFDLEQRSDGGRSVFLLTAPDSPEDRAEFRRVLGRIQAAWHVEGAAEIAPHVCGRGADAREARIILSVGPRRANPEPVRMARDIDLDQVVSAQALWRWHTGALAARRSQQARAEAVTETGAEEFEDGRTQVTYQAWSRPSARAKVPRYLQESVYKAMDRLVRRRGDLAAYVAGRAQMTEDALFEVLTPEQVDAVALALDSRERGLGFVLGDQTGFGKGRIQAMLARVSILDGRKVVFLSENAKLMTDFWRDIRGIRSEDLFRPFMMHGSMGIYHDETGELLYEPAGGDLIKTVTRCEDPYLMFRPDEERPAALADIEESRRQALEHFEDLKADRLANLEANLEAGDVSDDTYAERRAQIEAAAPDLEEPVMPYEMVPSGINLVMAPYSMISEGEAANDGQGPLKARWLVNVAAMAADAGEPVHIYADECHNIANAKSNRGENVGTLFDAAEFVTLASATSSIKIANILSFMRAGITPPEVTANQIEDGSKGGGKIYYEEIARTMAENGNFRCLEQDMSVIDWEYATASDEEMARNIDRTNRLAPVLNAISMLSGDMDTQVTFMNDRLRGALATRFRAAVNADARVEQAVQSLGIERVSFGAPLHRLTRMFSHVLAAEMIAERMIEDIRDGRKPIYAVDDTGEALMRTILEDFKAANPDQALDGARMQMPDWKDALRQTLDRVTIVRRRLRKNEDGYIPKGEEGYPAMRIDDLAAQDPRIAEAKAAVLEIIEDLPDLPLSPLDIVRNRLAAARDDLGDPLVSFEEISGRSWVHDGEAVHRRGKVNPNDIMHQWANGDLDSLVMTQSGMTGITLSDNEATPDKRPKKIYVGVPPANVRKFVQLLGRIFRHGAVTRPTFSFIDIGIPAAMKFDMLTQQHLRSLSALTTANHDHPALKKNLPEMYSGPGNKVAQIIIEDIHPRLKQVLGLVAGGGDEGEEVEDPGQNFFINKLLTGLAMLPFEEANRVLSDYEMEYHAYLEELDRTNSNPLHTKMADGMFTVLSRELWEGVDREMASAWDKPVWLVTARQERHRNPFRSDRIQDLVEAAQAAMYVPADGDRHGSPSRALSALRRNVPALLQAKLANTQYPSVDAALAEEAEGNAVSEENERLTQLAHLLRGLRPGASFRAFDPDRDHFDTAIVTGMVLPKVGQEHMVGRYTIHYVLPGDEHERKAKLSVLMRESDQDDGLRFQPGLHDAEDQVRTLLQRFDLHMAGNFTEERQWLDGNLIKAMEAVNCRDASRENDRSPGALGSLHQIRDHQGTIRRGVLLRKRLRGQSMSMVIQNADMATDYLLQARNGKYISSVRSLNRGRGVTVGVHNGTITVTLPTLTGKYGDIYKDEGILAMAQGAHKASNKRPVLKFSSDQRDLLRQTLQVLLTGGVRFYAPGSIRAWANDWTERHLTDTAMVSGVEPVSDQEPAQAALAALAASGVLQNEASNAMPYASPAEAPAGDAVDLLDEADTKEATGETLAEAMEAELDALVADMN